MKPLSKRQSFVLWFGSVLLYYLTGPTLYRLFGGVQGATALIPGIATGIIYGPLAGFLMGIVGVLSNMFLLYAFGEPAVELVLRTAPGGIALLLAGPLTGWVAQQGRMASGQLRQSEGRLSALLRQMPATVWTVDRDLRLTSIGGSSVTGVRVKGADVIDQTLRDIFGTYSFGAPAIRAHRAALAGETATYQITTDGHDLECRVDPFTDDDGAVVGVIGVAMDVTERVAAERKLKHLAEHDWLTNLWNRRRFRAELADRLSEARRSGAGGAIILLNLDGFKYLNDSLGHPVGDELLRRVASQLEEFFRSGGMVARLGGDEFACLLPGTTGEEACRRAEEVNARLRAHPLLAGGQPVTVGASAGVAVYPDHGHTADDLLENADLALHRAKEDGRDRVYLFCPDDGQRTSFAAKVTWEERIREALEHDRFLLLGQPILDLTTGEVSHYELLLRMEGANGESILPSQFIGTAERFGMIRSIDRWVIRSAIRLAQAHPDLRFTVNLSARALTDDELLPLIRQQLQTGRVDPSHLVFEITETAAISDLQQAARFVASLNDLGCTLALDDFGAGFTSFSTLRMLPVSYLKIDGSFVQNLATDPVNQRLVAAMSEMARALGKKTVAEFVENEATMDYLRECGIDYAQGYHIGKPGPVGEENRSMVTH